MVRLNRIAEEVDSIIDSFITARILIEWQSRYTIFSVFFVKYEQQIYEMLRRVELQIKVKYTVGCGECTERAKYGELFQPVTEPTVILHHGSAIIGMETTAVGT